MHSSGSSVSWILAAFGPFFLIPIGALLWAALSRI